MSEQQEVSRWRETVGHGFGTGRHKGGTKTWDVTNENTGRIGGTQTEHWDDSVDANVHLEPVRYGMHQGSDGEVEPT